MFLDGCRGDRYLHELDFRFEICEGGREFLFANHGLSLSDLAETIDLVPLGSSFYMVSARQPVTLEALIADRGLFRAHYGVDPTGFGDRYLRFDLPTVTAFFRSTREDDRLDCVLLGVHDSLMAEGAFERLLHRFFDQIEHSPPAFVWEGSWLATHDNHFFRMRGRSPELLRRLIAESLLGFFHHVEPRCRAPVPEALVDLLIAEFHTAPITCVPTEITRGEERFVAVQREEDRISALLQTAESSWIAHQLHPPPHLVGRALCVSYDLKRHSWTFEPWA